MKKGVAEYSDSEIINQILQGNADAFEYLIDRHGGLVTKIVNKRVLQSDVEENIQNVFIRVYQSLGHFKGDKGFKQWLASIAVRTCYDYWRKVYRHKEIPMSSLSEKHRKWLEQTISEMSEESLHEKGLQEEAKEILDHVLGKLSPEDRMVLELIHLEGYTGKEVAKLLGWSVANVKIRAFRSRKKIKRILSHQKF